MPMNLSREERHALAAPWVAAIQGLFSATTPIPRATTWTAPTDIRRVLGCFQAHGHLLFPDGGGIDIHALRPAAEAGCLEFATFALPDYVIRVSSVTLEHVEHLPGESYFWIATQPLTPCSVDDPTLTSELFVDLGDGRVAPPTAWDEGCFGVDDGGAPIPLPPAARLLERMLDGRPYVLVAQRSVYNALPETYSGLHATMSAREFRNLIERMPAALERRERQLRDDVRDADPGAHG